MLFPAHPRPTSFRCASIAGVAILLLTVVTVPDLAAKGPIKKLSLDPEAKVVDLFAGATEGVLSVKLIPLDENRANVFIGNETKEPITVAVPPTIATVNVLPQFQFQQPPEIGPGLNIVPDPNGLQQGNGQSTAGQVNPAIGQFPPGGPLGPGGNNPFGPGANFFSIPAERDVWLKLDTVCLDHGNPTPRPKMPYVLVPVEKHVESPVLRHVLADYDSAEIPRDVLQAAAWHLASDLDWEAMSKLTVRRSNIERPQFDRETLRRAWNLVEAAKKVVDEEDATTASVDD